MLRMEEVIVAKEMEIMKLGETNNKVIKEIAKEVENIFTNDEPVVQPILPAKTVYNRFGEEKQFTSEELIKHTQELKKKIEEVQNNLDYNFNGELMNIETITTIIKFIKAHKPRFEFQLALKTTGELKQVRRILDVDIIDLGDYGMDGQIYILPKEPPKYFTARFE